jgi:predicted acylesterase/phospholipase RssA
VESGRKKASVVLGGGGAKGFVHLGVLAEVIARGYDIIAIYGTSIGSIIGALFAYHFKFYHLRLGVTRADAQRKAVDSVTDLLLKTNFLNFADISLSPFQRGLVKGKRFEKWLKLQFLAPGTTQSIRFSDLASEIDLNITITNALNGESVVLSRDESDGTFVSDAVRASMSIQGVFLEVQVDRNGEAITAWDGGVTGNCRFDLSCAKYPDALTLASSVTYRGNPRALPNGIWLALLRPLLVSDRAADFWLRQIENLTESLLSSEQKQRLCIVRPDLAGVTTTSFTISADKRRKLISNGRAATRKALDHYEGAERVVE